MFTKKSCSDSGGNLPLSLADQICYRQMLSISYQAEKVILASTYIIALLFIFLWGKTSDIQTGDSELTCCGCKEIYEETEQKTKKPHQQQQQQKNTTQSDLHSYYVIRWSTHLLLCTEQSNSLSKHTNTASLKCHHLLNTQLINQSSVHNQTFRLPSNPFLSKELVLRLQLPP